MPVDTPTPGQVNYEAWWRCRWPLDTPPHWTLYADLTPADQRAWEAAAEAVAQKAVADTLEVQRLLAAAVREVPRPEEPRHA